jgi:hypothetical protein
MSPLATPENLRTVRRNSSSVAAVDDVNNDGIDDLVLHFASAELRLDSNDAIATLSGYLYDGTPFSGQDSVRIRTMPAN